MRTLFNSLSAIWPPLVMGAGLVVLSAATAFPLPVDLALCAGAIFFAADAGARLSEYHYAVAWFRQRPVSTTDAIVNDFRALLRFHQKSWCRRTALTKACAHTVGGDTNLVACYYRALGYRWFHLTPDGTFSRNSPMLRLGFWRDTLGWGRTA